MARTRMESGRLTDGLIVCSNSCALVLLEVRFHEMLNVGI